VRHVGLRDTAQEGGADAEGEREGGGRRDPSACHRRSLLPDLIALGWVALVAALYLSPAIRQGTSFGPFALGQALSGLGHAAPFHNGWIGDQIEEFIPWAYFDWQHLHALQFPLWNPYAGLGMPQFFNFQSSVLSLPDLLGYLVPAHLSALVAVAAKLLIAGTGAYLFCRVLGLSPWASAFGATVFELCGAFASEVGWPLGDVMAWAGWIFAASYLCWQGRRPRLAAALLAVSVAFAIYGGFPEGSLLLFGACLLFLGAMAIQGGLRHWLPLLAGWAVGLCLAAPLWLPGLQLTGLSGRIAVSYGALPVRALATLLIPKYYGSPLATDGWFGPSSYNETVMYIGIVALVAVGVGLYAGRARREVRALALTSAVLVLAAYQFAPTAWLLAHMPHVGAVALGRARIPLAFALSVLSAHGVQALFGRERGPAVRRALLASLGLVAAILLILLGRELVDGSAGLAASAERVRLWAFAWPLLSLLPVAVAAIWLLRRGAGRWLFALLMASETLFLLAFGVGINAWGNQFLPETSAERALRADVGTSLVGLAVPAGSDTQYPSLGIIPELNVAYGVSELAVYDPMVPRAYFSAWAAQTGGKPASGGWFVPSITTAATARAFGVGYVLAAGPPHAVLTSAVGMAAALRDAGLDPGTTLPALTLLAQRYAARSDLQAAVPYGSPGFAASLLARGAAIAAPGAHDPDSARLQPYAAPLAQVGAAAQRDAALEEAIAGMFAVPDWNGMTFAADLGGEVLWRVPGAARFSIAGGTVAATPTGDAAWSLAVDAPAAGQLIVRLTEVPGWHASIDGRPATLTPYHDVMQALQVPAGAHQVRIWYWPKLFSVGLALAALALLGGGLWLLIGRRALP
jgi:hypothetical protein